MYNDHGCTMIIILQDKTWHSQAYIYRKLEQHGTSQRLRKKVKFVFVSLSTKKVSFDNLKNFLDNLLRVPFFKPS